MTTWWRTDIFGIKIMPVEVRTQTPKAVIDSQGRRHMKRSEYHMYHPTFSEARSYLMTRISNFMVSRENDITKAREDLHKVFLMEEPKNAQI